jgi:hypothetical protein
MTINKASESFPESVVLSAARRVPLCLSPSWSSANS